jgi:hypothetical protein
MMEQEGIVATEQRLGGVIDGTGGNCGGIFTQTEQRVGGVNDRTEGNCAGIFTRTHQKVRVVNYGTGKRV